MGCAERGCCRVCGTTAIVGGLFRWDVVVPANGGAIGGGNHEGGGADVDYLGAVDIRALVELTDVRSEEVGGAGESGDEMEAPLREGIRGQCPSVVLDRLENQIQACYELGDGVSRK